MSDAFLFQRPWRRFGLTSATSRATCRRRAVVSALTWTGRTSTSSRRFASRGSRWPCLLRKSTHSFSQTGSVSHFFFFYVLFAYLPEHIKWFGENITKIFYWQGDWRLERLMNGLCGTFIHVNNNFSV